MTVEAKIVKKVSKAGNDYYNIQLLFANGYTCELFINNEQKFIIEQNA